MQSSIVVMQDSTPQLAMRKLLAGLIPFFFWLALQVSDFKSPVLAAILWIITVPLFLWLSLPPLVDVLITESRKTRFGIPVGCECRVLTIARVVVGVALIIPLVLGIKQESETRKLIAAVDRLERKVGTGAQQDRPETLAELERLKKEVADLRKELAQERQRQQQSPAPPLAQPSETPLVPPRLDPTKIVPVLWYAYEWDQHLGSTQRSPLRPIISDKHIRQKYTGAEIRFQVGIANLNEGIPLYDSLLHVEFLDGGLKVRADGHWSVLLPNVKYVFPFGVINNTAIGPDGALFMKFPSPGKYLVRLVIDGRGIKPIERIVTLELY